MIINKLKTREEVMSFLEGYVQERKEELDRRQLKSGLVKSYLLETVPDSHREPDLNLIFKNVNARLDRIDDTFYKVWDNKSGRYRGFLEKLVPRHPVYYTNEETKESDPWVSNLVNQNSDLDRLWLSGRTFEQLWQKVVEINPGQRFGRLAFEHQSIFEIDNIEIEDDEITLEPESLDIEEMKALSGDIDNEKSELYQEKRASRFTMVDRIAVIQDRLPKLQEIYYPLYSISQLRFPAVGKGGHDFYHNGKVTNRSDSFADHRAHLVYVLKIYKGATEDSEKTAWYSIEKTTLQIKGEFKTLHGAPVVMQFKEKLSAETFEKWITSTFQRKRNKFRLWGNPISLGTKKVHVYGVDRHLWQPIFLELTDRHIIAILPKGTCGNTIHRLVTNVQRYIDPAVDVWIGNVNYKQIFSQAIEKRKIKYE